MARFGFELREKKRVVGNVAQDVSRNAQVSRAIGIYTSRKQLNGGKRVAPAILSLAEENADETD